MDGSGLRSVSVLPSINMQGLVFVAFAEGTLSFTRGKGVRLLAPGPGTRAKELQQQLDALRAQHTQLQQDMVGRLKGTNSTDVEGEGHLAWEIASQAGLLPSKLHSARMDMSQLNSNYVERALTGGLAQGIHLTVNYGQDLANPTGAVSYWRDKQHCDGPPQQMVLLLTEARRLPAFGASIRIPCQGAAPPDLPEPEARPPPQAGDQTVAPSCLHAGNDLNCQQESRASDAALRRFVVTA
ncbi:hypothetical protein AK812_SmicGene24862 [Symbiodinium microadriaticum]|uniref:Uncharacterized protein n=1 Tax=Symbiodinium microadriaticum TaxID=2951 RepID=A0A1Q9DDJ8_SYMMI|nr:hypothetical protein AK812_SmicGene24862 [Symbiodinium microadriaticum]CAE7236459.1 unnamed protein product [Symbiodinium sp. KB8]CAE7319095.1 unnamed protein product [Symbiodinium microadriaticum]